MPLTPATHLGPYEIIAPLGAGGMGEVYRACDPRLDRIVAIKVVPALCFVLALILFAAPVAAAAPYAPPAPDELSSLERRHNRHHWWRVTVDSGRYEVRVRTLDAVGLAGLQPRRRSAPVPERIAWSEIARIDARQSHFRSKQVQGVIYGGIAAPVLAAMGGLQDPLPVFAVFAGAGLGGWLGGLYGDTQVHERPLYISRTLLTPAPAPVETREPTTTTAPEGSALTIPGAAAGDSTRDAARSAMPEARAPAAPAPTATAIAHGEPTPAVLAACRQIRANDLLRVRADFGMFEGYAERAKPEGLSGLRLSTVSGKAASTLGAVTWDRIERVEVRGNSAASGARKGAVAFGALGGLVGLAAIAVASAAGSGSTEPGGSWILAGAGLGAAAGAGLGAAIGAGVSNWRTVYLR